MSVNRCPIRCITDIQLQLQSLPGKYDLSTLGRMEPGIQHTDSSTAMWVVSMGVEHWAQGDHLSRKPGMLGNFTDVRGKKSCQGKLYMLPVHFLSVMFWS